MAPSGCRKSTEVTAQGGLRPKACVKSCSIDQDCRAHCPQARAIPHRSRLILYSAHPHQQSETIHLGDAMLGDIPVSVFGRRKPYVFQVAVKPPATLDFEQSDKRAAEICGAIAKLSSVAPKSLCPKLSWGSVTLLSEWRDGGWGAIFDIAQRT